MRDISPDLLERLKLAEQAKQGLEDEYQAERREIEAKYRHKRASLDAEVGAIQSLLDIESRRRGEEGKAATNSAPALPIKDFLVKIVRDVGPLSKSELRDMATNAGYFQKGENPGRSTHAQILFLVRAGRLFSVDGKLKVPPQVAGEREDPTTAGSLPH